MVYTKGCVEWRVIRDVSGAGCNNPEAIGENRKTLSMKHFVSFRCEALNHPMMVAQ